MPTKAELAEQLAAIQEQFGIDESEIQDQNGYYDPTEIHITRDGMYYCGEERKPGSWTEEFMDDKKARTLPHCPACLIMYEQINGVAFGEHKPVKKRPEPIEPAPRPEQVKPTVQDGSFDLWQPGLTISKVAVE